MDPLSHKVQTPKRRKKRKPLSQEVANMYKVLTVTVAILALATTASYLYMNSLKPAKGYTLKQLQLDYEELQSEQRALEHQMMEAQSFITIEEEIPEDMEETSSENTSYTGDSTFAQN